LIIRKYLEQSKSTEMVATPINSQPTTVAVIGCGPGGMFFLHALAAKRKALEAKGGQEEALAKLPVVSCFEKSSSAGGVWRSERDSKAVTSTNMYEGLWINAPTPLVEFPDYTFDDHFDTPRQTYLRRKEVLEYLMARVTQHEDIFQHVQFNTAVESVEYNDVEKKFVVVTNFDGTSTTALFDKCIWAGGVNGKPNMVKSVMDKLKDFKGDIVHSSEMNRLESIITGKRILMIGGSYSAEDLALQCTKLGSGKIYISTRCRGGAVSEMGSWPKNNVEVMSYRRVSSVKENSNGKTIVFETTYYDDESSDAESDSEDDDSFDEPLTAEVEDIDIIILCTGYHPNTDFLSDSINPYVSSAKDCPTWELPKGWRMKPNMLSEALGRVKPSKKLLGYADEKYYGDEKLYMATLLIDNTDMMILSEKITEMPLMELDIFAHICIRNACGELEIPSKETMIEEYRLDILECMDDVTARLHMDPKYEEAIWDLPKDHWYPQWFKYKKASKESNEFVKNYYKYDVLLLADIMEVAEYPASFRLDLSDREIKDGEDSIHFMDREVNSIGAKVMNHNLQNDLTRINLANASAEEKEWKTYRDADLPLECLYSDRNVVPLKTKWLDMED